MPKPISLTGDRPTGPLHIGHYAGSLANRLRLQATHEQYILLADTQALTDNGHQPGKVAKNVVEVALDYLAVGIDPARATICLQSQLPALAVLSQLYLNYVSMARLQRNPTIKDEISKRGFAHHVPAGFLCYPAAQAADITAFRATEVPVGEDQVPIIEQTNEIIRRINSISGRQVLGEAKPLLSPTPRLPAPCGTGKMSKSSGATINFSSSAEAIAAVVRSMYTDPAHLSVGDPGRVEGNVVFAYLDAFDPNTQEVQALKARYEAGGLGDAVLKDRLAGVLEDVIAPIRTRRELYAKDIGYVHEVIAKGTRRARAITDATCREVFEGLGLFQPETQMAC